MRRINKTEIEAWSIKKESWKTSHYMDQVDRKRLGFTKH